MQIDQMKSSKSHFSSPQIDSINQIKAIIVSNQIKNQESRITRIKNQESKIKNKETRIKNPESRIKNQESTIKNQE